MRHDYKRGGTHERGRRYCCPLPLRERAARCCHARGWVRGACLKQTPHPFEIVGTPLCPLPQGERARKARATARFWPNEANRQKHNCRVNRRLLSMRGSRSREDGVVQSQGCGFSLFSSCSVLLSTAKSGDQSDTAGADFSFSSRSLRGDARRLVWPAACFSPVIYRKKQGRGGSPSHVAAGGADHYLTRCRRGRG